MVAYIPDAWFLRYPDWYTIEEGVGYIPTEKAPKEAVEAMQRLNEMDPDDIA